MESDDVAAPALSRPEALPRTPGARLLTLAGLFLVWTVAWSTPAGRIGEDTKNDLYVDAWGLLRRALHLWDPQVTWGMVQNQGYGYLFPMGPFYAVLSEFVPVWIVQRLWWSTLLTIGYLATLALLRALGLGPHGAVHAGALAFALAPRVLSTLGAISPEAQTQLLAPAILLPLVLASRGRLGPRRAAGLSGLAILACGGVNATATLLAAAPAGLWLVTEPGWWRRSITWWWAVAAIAATAWWLGPLLLLGRYSPPFLDWIENSSVVLKSVGLLDVLKGTTHWLGHLVVAGGPWWPAGWALTDTRSVVIATSILGGLGLAGLALPLPRRGFLLACLLTGLAFLAIAHDGPFASPLSGTAQHLLDGPLAPFRNVHKADPLVRLPLVIGLVNAVRHLTRHVHRLPPTRVPPGLLPVLATGLVVIGAAPALGGTVATRGTFTGMQDYWRQTGEWLERHTAMGGSILLPSANFGEYTWGRTIDEPLRSLTTAPYAVRDAVPLTPAGTIRFLDEVTRRAQSGRDLRGAGQALLSAGVKYVVLRNDLDTDLTGGPPVAVTRSALLDTPGIARVAGFGSPARDATGTLVEPVEIYAISGAAAPGIALWRLGSVPVVSGASEALASLRESELAAGPVIFDGDARPGDRAPRIETDTFAARTRYFGATRGQDVTRRLTASQATASVDYFPWPGTALRTTLAYAGGLASVTASSALSDRLTFAGLVPARRPYAVLDGDASTAWLTLGDPAPVLTVTLAAARHIDAVWVRPAADRRLFGADLAAATRVRVESAGGSVEAAVAVSGTRIALPPGRGTQLRITILDTASGAPAGALTGLAEVAIPGLSPREVVVTPAPVTEGPTGGFVLGRDPDAFDGCARSTGGFRCLEPGGWPAEDTGPLTRRITTTVARRFALAGTLVADPAHPSALLEVPGVRITASSTRAASALGAARTVLDADPGTAWSPAAGDRAPRLTIRFAEPTRTGSLRVLARDDWLAANAPVTVAVTRGSARTVASLRRDGRITLPDVTAPDLTLQLLPDAGASRIAALEVTSLEISGFTAAALGTSIDTGCGSGPGLRVGAVTVPTAVVGRRAALAGDGVLHWRACADAVIPAGSTELSVGRWQGMVPAQVTGRSASAGGAAGPVGAAAAVTTPAFIPTADGGLAAVVEPAAYDRLVVLTQNASPGWRARAGSAPLLARTVDGYRQAFVLPAGAGGALVVAFAPDRAYRLALLGGGLLALALLAAAVWPARRREPAGTADSPTAGLPPGAGTAGRVGSAVVAGTPGRVGSAVGAGTVGRVGSAAGAGTRLRVAVRAGGLLVLGATLAGPLGAAAAALVAAGAHAARGSGHAAGRRAIRPEAAVFAVVMLVTVSGVVQAVFADGSGPGRTWVEATTRLLSLVALLIVVAARPGPWPARPEHARSAPARPAPGRYSGAGVPPTG